MPTDRFQTGFQAQSETVWKRQLCIRLCDVCLLLECCRENVWLMCGCNCHIQYKYLNLQMSCFVFVCCIYSRFYTYTFRVKLSFFFCIICNSTFHSIPYVLMMCKKWKDKSFCFCLLKLCKMSGLYASSCSVHIHNHMNCPFLLSFALQCSGTTASSRGRPKLSPYVTLSLPQ